MATVKIIDSKIKYPHTLSDLKCGDYAEIEYNGNVEYGLITYHGDF